MSVLFVDGWFGPDPGDWQSVWAERLHGSSRVVQDDWERPERDGWVARLDQAVAALAEPPVLVGHSLGVLTVLHWVATGAVRPARGALLVTPADVEENQEPAIAGFGPIPRGRLPFPSSLAASANDRWMSPARAEYFAAQWGSECVSIGEVGHLTGAYGPWPDGEPLLAKLTA